MWAISVLVLLLKIHMIYWTLQNEKKVSVLGFKIQIVKWWKLKQNINTPITNTKTIEDKTKQVTSELKNKYCHKENNWKKRRLNN